MIVLKYTYDKSITSTFSFSFNSGFTPTTTTEETSGNLVTVTMESDTAFTTIGIPAASEAGLVAVHYMDLSSVTKIDMLFERCINLTNITLNNSTTKLVNVSSMLYFYSGNPHKNPINIKFVDCDLSAITESGANNFIYTNGETLQIEGLCFENCVLSNGLAMRRIIGACNTDTKLLFKNCTTAPSTSFERMFYGTGRTEVDLSGIDFTNVTSTYLMFSNSQIRKLTLPKGDFYNLTNISMMFEGAYYIEEVDISDFHIMNPVNIINMFVNCRSLKKVNLSGININESISFNGIFGGSSVCEWFDISNLKTIPSDTTNFWKSQAVVENVGMLYCPANVINTIAPLLVGSGRTCNIYYHDAKLEDLTVDSRFNYIYCEEYHGDVVSTPDDLELYGLSDVQDTLDLTTGTYTQRVKKWNLAEEGYTFIKAITSQEAQGYVRFDFRQPQLSGFGNPYCISKNATHINNLGLPNLTEGVCTNTLGRCLGVANNNAFLMLKLKITDVASYDKTGLDEWIKANNFTVYYNAVFSGIDSSIKTETYQVDVSNPLKSYRNGSIQTSSQQLAPTLKTTLPISNKFTTTNLTSGSTYNVYFDGTATKLDAGGTIITNPVSPCEVECGGTTLTIEGTDIQNVRVLETTVKNEVGSVCGTTDVELSRVKCVRGIPNLLSTLSTDWENGTDYGGCIRYKYGIDVQPNEKYVFTVSNIGGLYYKEIAIWNTDTWVSNAESIITTQKLTPNTPYIFTVPSGVTKVYIYFPYDNTGNLNQAHEYELRMQEGTVDLGYGGQKEATIPLVCNLEQPIKLRSLGATYDSYNPVTGELTKRIGVSETDGSYSVLSSPIVDKFEKSYSFMSNLATSDQLLVYNGATKNGDVITLNKANRWSLVQLAGSCTRMEKGKQYMCILHDIVGDMTDVCFVRQLDTTSEILPMENNRVIFTAMSNASNRWCFIQQNEGMAGGGTVSFKVSIVEYFEGAERLDIPYFNTYEQRDLILQLLYPTIPQLYTNGQVKVYSDSDVYPTTILNGQSTNNYEINELNTSNNYTIRYDGECESINLANKSNTQGNNVLVKAGAASGNLTFVNDSGDINNVLLVQNDVREQEINHFTGLQTVEVSGMLIENQGNMWWNDWIAPSQYGASYQVDSPEFISVQPGETIYVVADNNNYTSLFEFDENYNMVNQSNNLILGNGSVPTPIRLDNGYYKNYKILSENTRYIKFTIPASTAGNAKNITQWSIVSFTRADIGNVPLFTNNTPYRGSIVNFPQPVQLNSLPDGTCDTYNPITGEYVQNVGCTVLTNGEGFHVHNTYNVNEINTLGFRGGNLPITGYHGSVSIFSVLPIGTTIDEPCINYQWDAIILRLARKDLPTHDIDGLSQYLQANPLQLFYPLDAPITTQLTPITIPTFEGGILQLITTDGKVFPMIEYSMPTNNRYDTSSWETGVVYTQRNMTEAYFNESTTPMTPTETMTLTTDHISSGSIILNDNGNGLIVLKGNYTGRDIPYFTGMRSVEAIEVETTPSPDQPLFGKGGRK